MDLDDINAGEEKKTWTRKGVETLIELWKANECLYNVKHPLYFNKAHRIKLLQDFADHISEKVQSITVEEIKSKINVMRTQFRKSRIKRANTINDSNKQRYIQTIWWFNKLRFLEDHMQTKNNVLRDMKFSPPKPSVSNNTTKSSDESEDNYLGAVASDDEASVKSSVHGSKWAKGTTDDELSCLKKLLEVSTKAIESNDSKYPEDCLSFGKWVTAELFTLYDDCETYNNAKRLISNIIFDSKDEYRKKIATGYDSL